MTRQYENIIVTGKSGAGKQPRIDVLTEIFDLRQLSTGNIFRTYLGHFNEVGFDGELDGFYNSASDRFIDDDAIQEILGVSDHIHADDIVLGLKAGYYINQGLFVPDDLTNALFKAAFSAMGYQGAVLDGFPRTPAQARFLNLLANEHGARLDAILLVENDDETIIKRTIGRRICTTCGDVYHIDYRPPPKKGGCGSENPDCHIIQRSDDTVESLEARLNEFRNKTKPAIDYLVEQDIALYKVPGNLPNF